ncbi:MAG TPA: hypothetical protein VFP59_16980 [Candidatus Angelobacter sp.]|nr:hypothetical protein [Candidatus Angelobacter sp.]
MSNRVLIRNGARELTVEELDRIAGGGTISGIATFTGPIRMLPGDDTRFDTDL